MGTVSDGTNDRQGDSRSVAACALRYYGVLGGVGAAGDTTMGLPRWPDPEWWLGSVEGLPRWLWAIALLWVGVLAAWACWVQAQTGRGADGKIAGRGDVAARAPR